MLMIALFANTYLSLGLGHASLVVEQLGSQGLTNTTVINMIDGYEKDFW